MLLSKDQIIGASDKNYRDVDVPEWGGVVRVGTLSEGNMASYLHEFVDLSGKQKPGVDVIAMRRTLVALCVVDETGERVFSSPNELVDKSTLVIKRLYDECAEINGIADERGKTEGN